VAGCLVKLIVAGLELSPSEEQQQLHPTQKDTSLQSMAQLLGVGISCWLNVPHLGAKLMRKVPGDKPPQNETFGRSGWVCKHFKDSEDSPKQSPEFQHTRTLAFMLARDVSLTFFN